MPRVGRDTHLTFCFHFIKCISIMQHVCLVIATEPKAAHPRGPLDLLHMVSVSIQDESAHPVECTPQPDCLVSRTWSYQLVVTRPWYTQNSCLVSHTLHKCSVGYAFAIPHNNAFVQTARCEWSPIWGLIDCDHSIRMWLQGVFHLPCVGIDDLDHTIGTAWCDLPCVGRECHT